LSSFCEYEVTLFEFWEHILRVYVRSSDRPIHVTQATELYTFVLLQQIVIGVAAVLGGLVLWKVIKNDDSVGDFCWMS
jgi:hypothetical protein